MKTYLKMIFVDGVTLASFLFALFVLIPLVMHAGNDARASDAPASRTVAVISLDRMRLQNIADQLTVSLGAFPTLDLVERSELDMVTMEQVLALSASSVTGCIQVESLIGADVLILLNHESGSSEARLQVVICDTATGARLSKLHFPSDQVPVEKLANILDETLSRLPLHVETVVSVADFVCRDLEYEYDYLQKSLAELLREVLMFRKGMAVVEVDEALSIGNEMDLAGGAIHRSVPVMVTGEYRCNRLAVDGPTIQIDVTLTRGTSEPVQLHSGVIPVERASQFVVHEVQQGVMAMLEHAGDPLDSKEQSKQLINLAQEFSSLGDFQRAAALREAAVLLVPTADVQRFKLIHEYMMLEVAMSGPFFLFSEARPTGENEIKNNDRLSRWHRALSHLEYLIMNQRFPLHEIQSLYSQTIENLPVESCRDAGLAAKEQMRIRDYLRRTIPALYRLAPHRYASTTSQSRGECAYHIIAMALRRIDRLDKHASKWNRHRRRAPVAE